MPDGEELARLAQSGATLVLHLAAHRIDAVIPELLRGGYRPGTPVAVVAFASWPTETVVRVLSAASRSRFTRPPSPAPR